MKTSSSSRSRLLVRSFAATALVATVGALGANPVLAQAMPDMHQRDMKSKGSDGSMKMHMAMQEGQTKMNQMEMSGDTDRDFAMMMRSHHQTGIEMAKAEVASGKDPEMVSEAKKIIASQEKDNKKFDAWLQKHSSK